MTLCCLSARPAGRLPDYVRLDNVLLLCSLLWFMQPNDAPAPAAAVAAAVPADDVIAVDSDSADEV